MASGIQKYYFIRCSRIRLWYDDNAVVNLSRTLMLDENNIVTRGAVIENDLGLIRRQNPPGPLLFSSPAKKIRAIQRGALRISCVSI